MLTLDAAKEYPTETQSRAIIRFQDCDPMRHLNNAKYFDYYYNAREDQIAQHYGFNPSMVYAAHQSGWVSYNNNINYVRPAMFDEWVRIHSRMVFFNENTLVNEYYMTNDEGTELKNVFWSTLKYVDIRTGRRVAHQPDVAAILSRMLNNEWALKGAPTVDRIRQIKDSLPAAL